MNFTVSECPLPGLLEIQCRRFEDARGNFVECYCERDFLECGIDVRFVQDNQSESVRGVLRGLHFQKRHPQAKLVRLVSGRVLDVVLDLRNPSPTFGQCFSVILDAKMQKQLFVPAGFAHGFYVLSRSAVFSYKCGDFYYPDDEGGVLWNSPLIKAAWDGHMDGAPLVSQKDARLLPFDPAALYFDMDGRWLGE